MAYKPKFIQIATSSVIVGPPEAGQIVDNLFGLDAAGNVWRYQESQQPQWIPLSTKRE